MSRIMVGLLAAVGTAMSVLAGLAHGDFVWVIIGDAAVATGLAAYLALPSKKRSPRMAEYSSYVPRSPHCLSFW
jgi:hypothetical protein